MRYFLLIGLLSSISFSSSAQALNTIDTVEIQQKAIRHVEQFERLLNLISQPEEYFREFGFDELIRSYYQSGSSRQVFRDSLVVIEDDLNPTDRGVRYRNLLTIKDYLNAFFSLYEKSERPGVSFTGYEVSPVKQDDFIYVEVFYNSKFLNRHQAFPDTPYPARPRKATVRAERQDRGWRVTLVDVSHDQSDSVPSLPTDSTQVANGAPAIESAPVSEARVALPIVIRPSPTDVPVPTTPSTTAVPSYSLDGIRRVYRANRTYSLPVENVSASTTLLLYRGGEQVADLSYVLTDESINWSVSRELPYGDGYQFRLTDPLSEVVVTSPTFAVKRRIPWPVIAGAAGAVVVLVAIIGGEGDNGGGEEPGTDELPAPPDPE